ncbi:MAG: carbohydrate ABC transporter permease [Provencibacterium sp.]|jgi:putative aldouronate transport system permease protein|nr:carbohydrate ABC transporter permease [Provencibacterium sp.]
MPKNKNRIQEGSMAVDAALIILMAITAFLTLYPLYYVLILSLSEPQQAATMRVYWLPKGLYLGSYEKIVLDPKLWRSYLNTILYAAAESAGMLCICSMAAYALSSKRLKGRKVFNIYLLIPMYFSGGIIPLFLLIIKMGLYNTPWAIIIPGCFSIWYTILIKSYFGSLPESLREAAMVDGANCYQTFLKIYLPVAKPILAVVALYTLIGVWNEWFKSSIFLTDQRLQPLQLYLRRILVEQTVDLSQEFASQEQLQADMERRLSSNQIKYSIIILSSLPMICIYPFFQKYFVKGVMLGSLKE